MDTISIAVLGGVIIFSIKSGVGCGLASLKNREILTVAFTYFLLSLFMGFLIGKIPFTFTREILSLGAAMHAFIAILLILLGLYTIRNWHKGCDVTRKSFLVMAVPCPACLAATFLASSILSSVTGIDGLRIGLWVGTTFLLGISITAFTTRKFRKPSTLGSAMVFLGLFYLLSIILIPAYLKLRGGENMDFISVLTSIILVISNSMLYPTLIGLILLTVYSFMVIGEFLSEYSRKAGENPHSDMVAKFEGEARKIYNDEVALEKLLQDFEIDLMKRLEKPRIISKIGPMLGLMGTLVPLGPALLGLTTGNIKQLAENLVIAFTTTVVGLLIGMICYTVTMVRQRWYAKDISDAAFIAENLNRR
jgi:predicted transporter